MDEKDGDLIGGPSDVESWAGTENPGLLGERALGESVRFPCWRIDGVEAFG